MPVQGDTAANERIRERIEFISNVLFLIEDVFLTVGPGYMTSQSSVRVNVRSPLYWVRNQLALHVKDLMIAKRTGWQVLKNLKNQVSSLDSDCITLKVSVLVRLLKSSNFYFG